MNLRSRSTTGPPAGRLPPPMMPRLGMVTQLVLRGDGLTTTSLEILTGRTVRTSVRAHWHLPLHQQFRDMTTDDDQYTGSPPAEPGRFAQVGFSTLAAGVDDELLIRDIDLIGSDERCGQTMVLAAATVVAVMSVLPSSTAHLLGTTDQPIGRLLADEHVQVRRELARWGLRPAGHLGERLGVGPDSWVPARSYLMRAVSGSRPLAVIEEWFAPSVFEVQEPGPGGRRSRSGPARRHR